MAIKIIRIFFLFVGILICLDALLPTKEVVREISELKPKIRRLSGNYIIIIFEDNYECSADLDARTRIHLKPHELVTVRSARFTKNVLALKKAVLKYISKPTGEYSTY